MLGGHGQAETISTDGWQAPRIFQRIAGEFRKKRQRWYFMFDVEVKYGTTSYDHPRDQPVGGTIAHGNSDGNQLDPEKTLRDCCRAAGLGWESGGLECGCLS